MEQILLKFGIFLLKKSQKFLTNLYRNLCKKNNFKRKKLNELKTYVSDMNVFGFLSHSSYYEIRDLFSNEEKEKAETLVNEINNKFASNFNAPGAQEMFNLSKNSNDPRTLGMSSRIRETLTKRSMIDASEDLVKLKEIMMSAILREEKIYKVACQEIILLTFITQLIAFPRLYYQFFY